MLVRKHRFVVTVFAPIDENPARLEMARVLEEMHHGDYIGQVVYAGGEDVPPEQLRNELLAIGNDGLFFSEPEEA